MHIPQFPRSRQTLEVPRTGRTGYDAAGATAVLQPYPGRATRTPRHARDIDKELKKQNSTVTSGKSTTARVDRHQHSMVDRMGVGGGGRWRMAELK